MSLNDLRDVVHTNATRKGWWDRDQHDGVFISRTFGDLMALIHSEVSEALEEFREGHGPTETYWTAEADPFGVRGCVSSERTEIHRKPEGIPTELADVIIRVLDVAGFYGIDIDKAVADKADYNAGRSRRHGGKAL